MSCTARAFPWVLLVASFSLVMPRGSDAADFAYIGSQQCRKCHIREYKSWESTKMAQAFESLKPGVSADAKKTAGLDPNKDYTHDAECLPCHVVGYGKKGGFVSVEKTPELVGVGCENCHGPGGTYVQDQYMSLKNKEYDKAKLVAVGLVGEITAETCTTCHNTKSPFVGDDYVFDFEKRKNEGIHEHVPLKYKH